MLVTYDKANENHKAADRLMKAKGLTGPQVELLRRAAETVDYTGKPLEFPGEFPTYYTRQDSLDALRDKGYARKILRYGENKRLEMTARLNSMVDDARVSLDVAFKHQRDSQEFYGSWREAQVTLNSAHSLREMINTSVLKITDDGREFVSKFESFLTPVGEEDKTG